MIQVAQDLKGKNPLELAQYAEDVAADMTGNAHFAAPQPALAEIIAKAAALRASQTRVATAETALSTERATARTDSDELKKLLTNEGTYVQGVANANGNTDEQATVIVKSGGMGVKSSGAPVGAMPAPEGLGLTQGNAPGKVDAHCHSVDKSSAYVWVSSEDADPNAAVWGGSVTTTKSKVTLENLKSGALVWVRVSAVGSQGTGPASDPMSVRVP